MGGWEDGRMGGWEDGRMGGWEDGRMAEVEVGVGNGGGVGGGGGDGQALLGKKAGSKGSENLGGGGVYFIYFI